MKSKLIVFAIVGFSILFMGYSHNPPTGRTGAPFDKKCTGCHSSSNPNGYDGTVELIGLPSIVEVNKTYPLTVKTTKTAGAPVGAAFQLAIVDSQDNTIGTLTKGPGTGTGTKNGRRYMENRDPRLFNNSTSVTWNFQWTSPAVASTAAQNGIKVYMTSLIINGNGHTSGDKTIFNIMNYNMQPNCSLTLQNNVVNDVSCNGSCDGKVTLTPSGGQAPYTYLWSNGNPNPNQLCAGNYSVTVVDNLNCSANTQFYIGNQAPIQIDFGTIDKLTCNVQESNVCPSISGGSAPYSLQWSTGGTSDCKLFTQAGDYSLTVTDQNGCEQIGTFTIDSDSIQPNISITNTESILTIGGCLNLSFTSSEQNANILWEGPNGWTSTEMNPSICVPGNYSLTVTSQVNGCSAQTSIEITQYGCDMTVNMATPMPLTCNTTSVDICPTVENGIAPYTYNWSNGSTSPCISVSQSGDYVVTVTDNVGCVKIANQSVVSDTQKPTISFSQTEYILNIGGCITLGFTSSESDIDVQWTGPNGFSSNESSPIVCNTGLYELMVTSRINGCSDQISTEVTQYNCDLSANWSDIPVLDCSIDNAHLCPNATGSHPPFSYLWSTSETTDCIDASSGGDYSVTITDNVGCTMDTHIHVNENRSMPTIVFSNNNNLPPNGCINLRTTSSESNISYLWTGPNNFSSTESNPEICTSGEYSLTITSLANGCSNSSNIFINQGSCDLALEISGLDTLTCLQSQIQLCSMISGGTSPYNLNWSTGETTDCITISDDMEYGLTVTDANQCKQIKIVNVLANKTAPQINFESNDYVLTVGGCLNLNFSSSDTNISVEWSGPDGWTSTEMSPMICVPGNYTLLATSLSNGCTSSSDINVTQYNCDITGEITHSKELSCKNESIQLCASISNGQAPYTYTWSDGNTSQCTDISESGHYEVTITDNVGCEKILSTEVVSNTNIPMVNLDNNDLVLKIGGCLELGFTSADSDLDIRWEGPDNWTSLESNPTICIPGNYTLIATARQTGCISTTDFVVTQYECSLNVDFDENLTLNCAKGEITLCPTLIGGIKPFDYQWGNGSTDSCITVTMSGEYNLIVTDSVGCKIENNVNIDEDFIVPDFQFAMEEYLLKDGDCLDLGISTTLDSVDYQWTGPNGWVSTESNPNICVAGDYTLTLTTLNNGCSTEKSLIVNLDTKNNDIGNQSIEIFPNPTTHFIQLSFSEKLSGTVSVFSLQGKRLLYQPIDDTKMSINLQNFSNGVYFLKIESEKGIYYEKILKQ